MNTDHVALPTDDGDRASGFHVDRLGAEVAPSPTFPVPAVRLQRAEAQARLTHRASLATGATGKRAAR